MANHSKSQLDFWRTQTWSRICAVSVGLRQGNDIERWVLGQNGFESKKASGAWVGYLLGTNTPYNGWTPVPDSKWAQLARHACPQSWPWFATPVWYLLEDEEFTPGQLVECAELLPESFRENLIYEPEGLPMRTALRLRDILFDWVYQFTDPMNPWALGATACAMRRAELAGNAPAMRWAAVALTWQLEMHASKLDPWIAEPLNEVRQMLVNRFKTMLYFDGMYLPIGSSDHVRFGCEREKYLAWSREDPTVEGATSWPPPKPAY
jgi:hypothetical protein